MTMLFLASATFALPTVLFNAESMNAYSPEDKHHVVLSASRWCSIYIMSAYVAFLIFQLGTHAELFKSEEGEEEEEDAKASLSPTSAMLLLFVVTCFVAASSEWLSVAHVHTGVGHRRHRGGSSANFFRFGAFQGSDRGG